MDKYQGYLIDLDGTVYRGEEKIEAAVRFVEKLYDKQIPYLFVTNNSAKRPQQVADKLEKLGVPARPQNVMTSSMAAASVMAEKLPKGAAIYMIGEEGLYSAMEEKGFKIVDKEADAVVIGIDRGLTYEKLARACLEVRKGAAFFSTNPDVAFPSEEGLVPGNGSLTAVVSTATGCEPEFVGKPEAAIIEQALEMIGTNKEKTIMVGDNYDTDILAGIRAGIKTLLVHTGVTTREMLQDKQIQPTHVVHSLSEWQID
ncbi:MAG TPA: TIGR01457 family HAD-type hydrolase [Bacillales bacterium]|nr:TIGR01457 family HAD-type hydrolase [Bacillales bacterium]